MERLTVGHMPLDSQALLTFYCSMRFVVVLDGVQGITAFLLLPYRFDLSSIAALTFRMAKSILCRYLVEANTITGASLE